MDVTADLYYYFTGIVIVIENSDSFATFTRIAL